MAQAESHLDANEWQIKGIQEALQEAESPTAEWISHDELKAKWGLSVKLPHDLENRLDHLAAVTHRPKSFHIREAINEYLEEHEDTFIALSRLKTPMPTVSLDDIEKRLGLAN